MSGATKSTTNGRVARMDSWAYWLAACVWFMAGFGWGQWKAEKAHREQRATLENHRIVMSMPADPRDAARALELMSEFMREVEVERSALRMVKR